MDPSTSQSINNSPTNGSTDEAVKEQRRKKKRSKESKKGKKDVDNDDKEENRSTTTSSITATTHNDDDRNVTNTEEFDRKPTTSADIAEEGEDDEEEHHQDKDDVINSDSKKRKRIRKRQKTRSSNSINTNENCEEQPTTTTTADEESTNDAKDTSGDTTSTTTNMTIDDEMNRTIFIEGIPYDATYEEIVDFLLRLRNDESMNHSKHRNLTKDDIIDIRCNKWQDTGRYRGYGHVVLSSHELQLYAIQSLHHQYFYGNTDASVPTNDTNDDAMKQKKKKNRYISVVAAKTSMHQKQQQQQQQEQVHLSAPSTTIVLRNISYSANEQDVYDALYNYQLSHHRNSYDDEDENRSQQDSEKVVEFTIPTVESGNIRIVRHSIPPYNSKGFVYITFPTVHDAQKCIFLLQQSALQSNTNHQQQQQSKLPTPTPLYICNRMVTQYDYDHGRVKGSYRTNNHTLWKSKYDNNNSNK